MDYGKAMVRRKWPARQEDEKGVQRRGSATTSWHDERTRGQHNERTMRDDVNTSWQDKTMRGRHNKTTRRQGGRRVERRRTNQPARHEEERVAQQEDEER